MYIKYRFQHKEKVIKPNELEEQIVKDILLVENLSVAMQRCYLVVNFLMQHVHAISFNYAVDINAYPSYYKTISQPISLIDIKNNVLHNQYTNITDFYCDVILVLENAIAYNHENQPMNLAAQKLIIIFERTFLEVVLTWDHPLPYIDSCHACR
jgi:hypothetical protein